MLKFSQKTPSNTALANSSGVSEGTIRNYKSDYQKNISKEKYEDVLNNYKNQNFPFLQIEDYIAIKKPMYDLQSLREKIASGMIPHTHYIDGNNNEFYYIPSILDDFNDIDNELQEVCSKTKIICLGNFKGGVSKTTNSCNIAATLAYMGKKVLLIDGDVQGNATMAFGYSKGDDFNYTVVDLIIRLNEPTFTEDLKDTIITVNTGKYFKNGIKGSLDILPNSVASLYDSEDLPQYSRELGTMENTLKRVIAPIKDNYDYIIIDMPPRADLNLRMSIMASDYLIFSLTPEVFSEKGIPSLILPVKKQQSIYKQENNKDFVVLGGINSRVKSNINLHSITAENSNAQLETLIGEDSNLFNTQISELSVISESQNGNGAALFYQPTDKAVKLYFELTMEILERIYMVEMNRQGQEN